MEHPGKPTIHHVTLKKHQEVARGTMAFYFDRPPTFTFKAGQFIDLSLPNLSTTEPQGHSRAFTLASAPSEQQLMVATRLRDTAFKRMFRVMPLGSTVDMAGHSDNSPCRTMIPGLWSFSQANRHCTFSKYAGRSRPEQIFSTLHSHIFKSPRGRCSVPSAITNPPTGSTCKGPWITQNP